MLPEVQLYLTIPINTATYERTFSAVRHVLRYKSYNDSKKTKFFAYTCSQRPPQKVRYDRDS